MKTNLIVNQKPKSQRKIRLPVKQLITSDYKHR